MAETIRTQVERVRIKRSADSWVPVNNASSPGAASFRPASRRAILWHVRMLRSTHQRTADAIASLSSRHSVVFDARALCGFLSVITKRASAQTGLGLPATIGLTNHMKRQIARRSCHEIDGRISVSSRAGRAGSRRLRTHRSAADSARACADDCR